MAFRFLEYKKFFLKWIFFLFFELGMKSAEFRLQEYKKNFLLRKDKKFFLSGYFLGKNILSFREELWGHRPESAGFHSWNIIIILILELQSSISGNIRDFCRGERFFVFWAWAQKARQVPAKNTTHFSARFLSNFPCS